MLLFEYVEHAGWRWGLCIGLIMATLSSMLALVQHGRQAYGRIASGLATARLGSDAHTAAVPVSRELEHALAEIDELCDILERQRLATDDARRLRQQFFKRLPSAAFVFDEQCKLVEVNKPGAAILGASPAALVGSTATSLGMDHLLDRDRERFSVQFDGREVNAYEFLEGGHKLTAVFTQSREEPSATLRDRERGSWQHLFRVLVHEVNNSLTPMRTIADGIRIQLGEALPQDWRSRFSQSVEAISGRAQRLSKFVDGYGELAKLPHPVLAPIEVGPWLRNLVSLERRVRIRLEDGPATTVHADQTLMDQALLNLLINAAEASQSTDGDVQVTWSLSGAELCIDVVDEGPGLAPNLDIFLPNVTTKATGNGLGLALCREIVEAHGGSIEVSNRQDRRGCIARVRIPREGVDEPITEIPRAVVVRPGGRVLADKVPEGPAGLRPAK